MSTEGFRAMSTDMHCTEYFAVDVDSPLTPAERDALVERLPSGRWVDMSLLDIYRDRTILDRAAMAHLIRQLGGWWDLDTMSTIQVLNTAARVVESYDRDQPCRYDVRCMIRGRCPFDPVCNH